MSRPVVVFDSGIGGLSVLAEIRAALGQADIVYVADDAAFPYGAWEDEPLAERILALTGDIIARFDPALVVMACNTASTLVLERLRKRFAIPFVGTVPAIKPAAEKTRSGLVSVLATPGTMRRDYTRSLIRSFASSCHVRLVGSDRLAGFAELHIRGDRLDEAEVLAEIAPAFLEQNGARTDVVVLACTHYPFLQPVFDRLAPWPVEWINPAAAIARQVVRVLREGAGPRQTDVVGAGGGRKGPAFLTSGRHWPDAVGALLRDLGLEPNHAGGFGPPPPEWR